MGNGPRVLMDALTPPPPIAPPFSVAPLPLAPPFPRVALLICVESFQGGNYQHQWNSWTIQEGFPAT